MTNEQQEAVRLESKEFAEQLGKLINARLRAANERKQYGVTVYALYLGLRTCSAFLLRNLNRAGITEAEAIHVARDIEKAVREEVRP